MSLVRFLLLATTKPVKIFLIKMLIYSKKWLLKFMYHMRLAKSVLLPKTPSANSLKQTLVEQSLSVV